MKNQFQDLANKVAETTDQTQTATNTSFQIPEAGGALARFVDYIEVGLHAQKAYKGTEKSPAPKVILTFELTGSKYVREIDVNGTKKKIADRITITIPMSLHEKAGFKKLFKKMTYGRSEITHMSQMLGEGFLLTIVHNVVGEGDEQKTYANITDDDNNYLVDGPFKKDPLEGTTTNLKVPEAIGNYRMFVWDMPTKECWDSVFIDGEREKKDAKGKVTTVSKNYIQNMILSALNFEGSPIDTFLEGSSTLPDNPEELIEEEVVDTTKKTSNKSTPKKEVESEEDPLVALGLA